MRGPSVSARGDWPDLVTALIFIGLGTLGLFMSADLDGGTLAQMGPGFLPRVVCGLLLAVGFVIGLPALKRPAAPLEPMKARPLAVILISVIGFGLAVTHLGFVLASLWLVLAGAFADPGGKWQHSLALAGGLTLFGAVVFVYGLGVQVPLWPF